MVQQQWSGALKQREGTLSLDDIKAMFKNSPVEEKVLVDVKGLYKVCDLKDSGMKYWRL